jgi:hypothetical protein
VAAEMEQNDTLAPFVDDFITMAKKTYDIKAALEAVLPDYVPGNMIKDLVGEAVEEDVTESMCSLKCKHCGDMLGQPTTDCECDSMDPKGDHWEMVDIDGDGDDDIAFAKEEIEEVDEATESLAKLKAMAGVGSKFRSNHGIHEGEEGYQLTPRSIVARELRKLQDIEKDS